MKNNLPYILIIVGLFIYILFFSGGNDNTNKDIKELEKHIISLEKTLNEIDLQPLIINIKQKENEIINFNIDSVLHLSNRDSLRAIYNPR